MRIVSLQRLVPVLATLVVWFFTATLTDTPHPRLLVRTVRATAAPHRDGRIDVLALDSRGHALGSAQVAAFWMDRRIARLAAFGTTSPSGLVSLANLPFGTIWLVAEAPGHARVSQRVQVHRNPLSVRLVLPQAHHLTLRAKSTRGRPVARARVLLRCAKQPLPFAARTDARGQAAFSRLCPPPYALQVSAPGYETWSRRIGRVPSSLLEVRLRPLASLTIRVVTKDGSPAPLATVLVTAPGLWPPRRTVTTAFGRAVIGGLPKGNYAVAARRGEWLSSTRADIPLSTGGNARVTLTLHRGRMLRVQVVQDSTDDQSVPVENARVVVTEGGLSLFPHEGLTDQQGTVRLGPFEKERPLDVVASAEGFFPTRPAHVTGNQTSVTVVMVKGGALVGEVVDERGFPVAGATIEVVGTDLGGLPVSLTPSMVRFQQEHFAWGLDGPPRLIPMGQLGVMPGPVPPIPHAGPWSPSTSSQKLPLSPASRSGTELPERAWVTGGKGKFRAWPVPPGQLGVIVRHPAYIQAISPLVTVGPGGEGRVHVVLYAGGSIRGVVLDDRRYPLEGVLVRAVAKDGSGQRSTLTDRDGNFSFSALPGEVILTAARPQSIDQVAYQTSVHVEAGERKEVEIVLPRAREPVHVLVVDDRGYPIDRARVRVRSLSEKVELHATRFTDKKGQAVVEEASGLRLQIEASADGFATTVQKIDKAGEQVRIELRPGCDLVGSVQARDGLDLVAGAKVTVWTSTGQRVLTTDRRGRFELQDLGPQRLRFRIEHEAYVMKETWFTIPEDYDPTRPLTLPAIQLQEAGKIEGTVVDDRGNPVSGAWVAQDHVPEILPVGPLPPGVVRTDRHGHFELPSLPEGQLVIEAYAPGVGRGHVEDVAVRTRQTTKEVRIELERQEESSRDQARLVSGVAVQLVRGSNGELRIQRVIPGSLADRAGLRRDDILEAVDDRKPSSVEQAYRWLQGPERKDVVLTVVREGRRLRVRLGREPLRAMSR